MNCIGKIDTERSMYDQLDDYEVNGYAVKDLKPIDRALIEGIALAIDVVDNYSFMPDTGSDKLDEIVGEYWEQVVDDVMMYLLSALGENLFSIMDNDEYYYEDDEEGDVNV